MGLGLWQQDLRIVRVGVLEEWRFVMVGNLIVLVLGWMSWTWFDLRM